ncbi:MAG: hypothetical protein IJD91_09920 [Clostridia bacterium]|nr:hypothetical protein [Clostridia bacterium]
MKEDPWHFYNDEMIERLVEDLLDNEMQEHQRICDEIMAIQGIEPIEAEMEQIIHCPDGYIFKDENGNVINAQKIVLEKKKKEYPKTYEECAEIIAELTGSDCNPKGCMGYMSVQLSALQKLLICRDAYWKIAGEEMGLGKPWEPDWDDDEWPDMYYISFDGKYINKEKGYPCCNMILIFPTEEMRDAFKENFDPDIEICKKLL